MVECDYPFGSGEQIGQEEIIGGAAITEILHTYAAGVVTNIKIRFADGKYENIDYDYWDSGDESVTINGNVYSYAAGIDGCVRQIVHAVQATEAAPAWTKTITTSYGYDASGLIERIGRTVA